jgi:hypothetical protein
MIVPGTIAPVSLLEVSPADHSVEALIQAYDGRDWYFNGTTYRVEVYGVHEDGCCQWVQLLMDGPSPRLVTVRLCKDPEPGPGFISKFLVQ